MLSQLPFKLPFGKQNRWPNPQESTGVYLATVGHNKSCWEAVGQARSVFGTLQIEIGEYIDQTCESLSKDVVWSLYMVGRTRQTAFPTVTFISHEPGPRQRLKALIKESTLLEKHPGFITMDIDRPPGCKTSVIKTLGGLDEKRSAPEDRQIEQITISAPPRNFMGTSIYLNERGPDLVATGGGIVQSKGKAYLTSVAHPFEKYWNDRFPEAAPPGDYVFDIDETSDSEEEDETMVDITSGGSMTSNSVQCDASDCSLNSESDAWSSNTHLLETPLSPTNMKMTNGLPSVSTQIHTILWHRRTDNQMSDHTSQDPTHSNGGGIATQIAGQYPPGLSRATTNAPTPALAQDIPLTYNLSGPIISSARGGTFSLDYSLFELPDSMLQRSESSTSDKSLQRNPSSAPREPRPTEIVVHTASGPVAGRLLATPSFMQPAQGMLSQQLWTVIMEGTLSSGLCGSWVMDASSGDVFGHIIAGAPADGFAYMIPFYEILDDLNLNFGSDWTLAEPALRMRDCSPSRSKIPQSRSHEPPIHSKSPMGSSNFDLYTRRGHLNAESLDDLSRGDGVKEDTINLGDIGDSNPTENFRAWINSNSVFAAGDTGHNPSFIPQEKLRQYFAQTSKVDILRRVLHATYGTAADIDVETIRESYLKVFSILLLIGKARHIQDFVLEENMSDSSLPYGPGDERILEDEHGKSFYDDFFQAQWQFCAPVLNADMDASFDERIILPFTSKTKLHDGGSAVIYKIKVHPEYHAFRDRWEEDSTESTFVLKTYSRGTDAKRMFENEIAAFRKLSNSVNRGSSIIKCYSNFIQGQTYNIILEYADQGDLESVLQHERPPSTAPDIVEFWENLLPIIDALKVIHNSDTGGSNTGSSENYVGYHYDIKPQNILLRSSDHRFILADFGLSKFKDNHHSVPDPQWEGGTRTYGAPECYRADSETKPLVKQNIDIWSFGCVLSEVATWLALGRRGLNEYRQLRADELRRLGRGDDDCFHDGENVLGSVQEHLKNLRNWISKSDPLTSQILDVVDSMLLKSSKRPDAKSVQSELEHAFHRWKNNFDFSQSAADSSSAEWNWRQSPSTKFPKDRGWVVEALPSHRLSWEDLELELTRRFGCRDFAIKHRHDRFQFSIPRPLNETERREILDSPWAQRRDGGGGYPICVF